MGGSQNNTSTTSSASTDPNVTKTVDQLLGGVQDAATAGPHVFNQSLYSPAGATTQGAQAGALAASGNPTYTSGITGAISSLGNAAAGNDYGTNDPGYANLRAKAGDDALKTINGAFNNSGRFGGGSNAFAAGQGVTNALSGLDYQNFQNDRAFQQSSAAALPGLYQGALAPSATQGAVGAAQDANSQATLLGQNDLFTRQNQAKTDLLAKLSSILAGTGGQAGTTTTTSQPAPPWYQSALGLAGSLL
jgi:hypothetical protein